MNRKKCRDGACPVSRRNAFRLPWACTPTRFDTLNIGLQIIRKPRHTASLTFLGIPLCVGKKTEEMSLTFRVFFYKLCLVNDNNPRVLLLLRTCLLPNRNLEEFRFPEIVFLIASQVSSHITADAVHCQRSKLANAPKGSRCRCTKEGVNSA